PRLPPGGIRQLEPAVGRIPEPLETHGRDRTGRVALEDLGTVRIAEPANVRARPALAPGEERHARNRAATHGYRVVAERELVDLRPGRAVEAPPAKSVEHSRLRAVGAARPDPCEAAVVAGMMRVVGRDAVQEMPPLARLVPVQARVAAADLELTAGVVDLYPDEPLALLELVGPKAAPVRVREIGHAAVGRD